MDAILLAAGNSIRFGENKLLYHLNGKPMYRYMLELLARQKKAGVLDHVIVVSQYEEIFRDLKSHFLEIEAVRNTAPELGISESIRIGLADLESVAAHSISCLFTVADQPHFTMESLIKIEQFWQTHNYGIAAASYNQKIGNPVIFASKYYEELKRLEGDAGGKKVLYRHMDDTGLCEVSESELIDLDTADAVREYGGFRSVSSRG